MWVSKTRCRMLHCSYNYQWSVPYKCTLENQCKGARFELTKFLHSVISDSWLIKHLFHIWCFFAAGQHEFLFDYRACPCTTLDFTSPLCHYWDGCLSRLTWTSTRYIHCKRRSVLDNGPWFHAIFCVQKSINTEDEGLFGELLKDFYLSSDNVKPEHIIIFRYMQIQLKSRKFVKC